MLYRKDLLIEELLQYNLAVFHFVQHYLIDLYSSESLHRNIFLSTYCKMIAAYNGFGGISSMNCLYPFYKVLAFFANRRFTFPEPK